MKYSFVSMSALLVFFITACGSEIKHTECYRVATETGALSNNEYGDFVWNFLINLSKRNENRFFFHDPFGDEKHIYLYADCGYLDSLYDRELKGLFSIREISAAEFDEKRRQMNPTRAEYEEQFGKVEFE